MRSVSSSIGSNGGCGLSAPALVVSAAALGTLFVWPSQFSGGGNPGSVEFFTVSS